MIVRRVQLSVVLVCQTLIDAIFVIRNHYTDRAKMDSLIR